MRSRSCRCVAVAFVAVLFCGASLARAQGQSVEESFASESAETRARIGLAAWHLGWELMLLVTENTQPPKDTTGLEQRFAKLREIAAIFGAELPPLPRPTGTLAEDRGKALAYMMESGPPRIQEAIARRFPDSVVALFQFPAYVFLGGFLYSDADDARPRDDSWLVGWRKVGARTGLPSSAWAEPIDLMEHRASPKDVSRAWIQTNKRVRAHFERSLNRG